MKSIKTIALATLPLVLAASIGYIARTETMCVPKPTPGDIIITPTHHINNTKTLAVNKQVTLPMPDAKFVTGVINSAQETINHTWQYGGRLQQGDGTFALAVDQHGSMSGVIIVHLLGYKEVAYVLKPTAAGDEVVFEPAPINSIICSQLMSETNADVEAGAAVAPGTITSGTATTAIKVPQLASRPAARVHVYLDFDGEKVTDPLWNGGRLIDAKAPPYTEAQIREIWTIVAERYAAFNINVTTRLEDYTKAGINSRTRAIFTPSNEWRKGFGGIALINSMRNAGKGVWSPTVPCWVFTNMLSRLRSAGECAAHEIGHTLGLTHDGVNKSTYYTGHGAWAPIMGTAYDRPVAQWSKGEYTGANNMQDDIATILTNKDVTYAITQRVAPTLTFVDGIRATGVICNERDVATYRTSISKTGKLTLTCTVPPYGALNTMVELVDANGRVVASGNALNALNTIITTDVVPGVYMVRVQGAAEGDVKTTGYSKYGSVGTFTLVSDLK